MRPAKATSLLIVSLLATPAAARTVRDEQLWTSLIVGGPLGGPWQGQAQVQNRLTNGARTRSALMVRGVLGYALSRRVVVSASYAHIDLPLEPNSRRGEDQLYQQVAYIIGPALGGTMSTRLRLEQRWRDGREKTGWRVRTEFRYARPLGRGPDAPSLVLWEEPLVELKRTDFGQTAGDLQIRTFAGLSIPISRRARIDPGYLNISGHRQNAPNLFYHIGQVTLNYRF